MLAPGFARLARSSHCLIARYLSVEGEVEPWSSDVHGFPGGLLRTVGAGTRQNQGLFVFKSHFMGRDTEFQG